MRKLILLVLITLFAAYAGWAERRPEGHYLSDLRSRVTINQGQPSGRGNLLGVQPELFSGDYQNVERLRLKFEAYLEKARRERLLNERTIVVFPEHVGTWLVVADEKPEVYQAKHLDEAMEWMAVSNPLKVARSWLIAKGNDRLADALFRMKAVDMAHDYQTLFGGLARRFGVTVVAGSIILPNPKIHDGRLLTGNGRLYNASLTFDPKGRPLGKPLRKVIPLAAEHRLLHAGDAGDLRLLPSPAGRLAVLLGIDSWYPANYAAFADQADILVIPAFLPTNDHWTHSWAGKSGATPIGVDLHAGEHSEAGTWAGLVGLNARLSSGARSSIAVFFRGHLWDLGGDGNSLVADRYGYHIAAGGGAQLINLWL